MVGKQFVASLSHKLYIHDGKCRLEIKLNGKHFQIQGSKHATVSSKDAFTVEKIYSNHLNLHFNRFSAFCRQLGFGRCAGWIQKQHVLISRARMMSVYSINDTFSDRVKCLQSQKYN